MPTGDSWIDSKERNSICCVHCPWYQVLLQAIRIGANAADNTVKQMLQKGTFDGAIECYQEVRAHVTEMSTVSTFCIMRILLDRSALYCMFVVVPNSTVYCVVFWIHRQWCDLINHLFWWSLNCRFWSRIRIVASLLCNASLISSFCSICLLNQ